jgi:hypothetical protein
MTTLHRLALSALAVAGFAATAPAQYQVPTYRNPFPPAPPPQTQRDRPPVYEQPTYSPPPVIVQAPPVVARPRVPVYDCLDEFERCFRPCPGHHHVVIVHPVTKRPVEVCFDLPDCKLRDFDVRRRSIEFDYGKHEVRIEFNRDGTVCVHDGHGH